MILLPKKLLDDLHENICKQTGTFLFEAPSLAFRDADASGFLMSPMISGGHIFLLERDGNFVSFYHSSPGTGTRISTIDFNEVPSSNLIRLAITWTPEEINFHLGTAEPNNCRISAKGRASTKQFRVSGDGELIQIGNKDFDGVRLTIFRGGKPILLPTAIESWRETLRAINVLLSGTSVDKDHFESVVSNLVLVLLVSGMESYAKERLHEIELEGVCPNTQAVIDEFLSSKNRSPEQIELFKQDAIQNNISLLEVISRKFINFQNYDHCKKAFKKAYGIEFGEIGLSKTEIEELKRFIIYRHRIIHVSVSPIALNQPDVPPEKPVFSDIELANKSIVNMSNFIEKLHIATLFPDLN